MAGERLMSDESDGKVGWVDEKFSLAELIGRVETLEQLWLILE